MLPKMARLYTSQHGKQMAQVDLIEESGRVLSLFLGAEKMGAVISIAST